MKKEGYITVYLSLIIATVLIFIITLIEGIRVQTIKFETECVMDIGLNSIFAEYNRELLDQYGLLAIDSSYGGSEVGADRTKAHLLQYMNRNFNVFESDIMPGYKKLTAIHADNASLSDVSYLSDDKGMVLKYQIIKYMKEKTGLSITEEILDKTALSESESKYRQLEKEKNASFEQIGEILNEINEVREQEEKKKVSIENPAEYVEKMRQSLLLDMAVKDSNTVLHREVNLSEYISKRSYEEGAGLREVQLMPDGMVNDYLFCKYLMEKCGYYGNLKGASRLGYQLEYLLFGKSNDFDNLDAFAEQMFRARYVINAAYLFTNSTKVNQASALAATVTAGIGSVQLSEVVKTTILFSWCYAETMQDLRILFDGKAVAWVKDDNTWNVPLSELLTFTATLDSYRVAEGGKKYCDYLLEFLLLKDEKILRMRLMDIMEMDIRMTAGNRYFGMDSCIYQSSADVNVTSDYGYGFSIEREYSYE